MKRRWVRRTLFGLLALLVLLLLLITGAYLYLSSDAGGARVRDVALDAMNEQFKGKLTSQKVDVSANHVVLEGLKLYDPEGVLVAEIARVEVDVSPLQLLGREVSIPAARVISPRLYLKKDDRGLNLLRALEAKNLRPSDITGTKGPAQTKSAAYSIAKVELTDGYVDYVEELDDPSVEDRHVRATGLKATGEGSYSTGPSSMKATLQLDGALELPTTGPIKLTAKYEETGKNRAFSLSSQVADAVAELSGTTEGTEKADVALKALSIAPQTARAFLPSWPLKATATLKGTLLQRGNVFSTDSVLTAGESAQVTMKGGFDIARFRVQDVDVNASHLNMNELLHDGPKTDLALRLTANGGGTSLNNLNATLTLDVPQSDVSGQVLGPIKLRAEAKDGRFHVPELFAVVPGARLTGGGEGDMQTLDFKGELNATDLSRLARTVGELTPQRTLPLSGAGKLRFHVTGHTKHPALSLDGNFASLRFQDYRLTGLSVDATLADVTRPLEADGTLRAAEIRIGDDAFKDLAANVHTRGRLLSADLTASGLTDLIIRVAGTLDEDSEGLLLSELNFEYPEAKWTLTEPSHLRWPEEGVTVPRLSLASGSQRLSAQLSLVGKRMDAKVDAEQLDLSLLPAALVDKSWNLGGTVNLEVTAKGHTAKPAVTAKVELAGATFKDVQDASLLLDGSYERDRVKGTVDASAEAGAVRGRFDVPVTGLLKRRHVPIDVEFDVPRLELQKALAAAGRTETAEGTVVGGLKISGFADAPQVVLTLKGTNVRYGEYPPADQPAANFTLDVSPTGDNGALTAKLDAEAFRSHALVVLETPLTVSGLRSEIPDVDSLMNMAVKLSVNADRIDLSGLDTDTRGLAALDLIATGTARAPQVTANVQLNGVQRGPMRPIDGSAALSATANAVSLKALISNEGQPLLNFIADAQAPMADLIDAERREKVPLKVDGRVSPVAFSTLRALTGQPLEEEEDVVNGTLTATLKASGTLSDPRFNVEGTVDKLGISEQALGRVGLSWVYSGGNHSAAMVLASPSSGSCDIKARTRLDLSAAALKKPIEWKPAPIDARLDARNFDLQFLSGIHPMLRTIAGTLDAAGTVKGTLGAPVWDGRAEWKDGRIALMGYGDYRKVHLKASASNERIHLEDLTAQSGGGTLNLTADAVKSGPVYALTMKGKLDRFPIIYDDQLFAVATLDTTARGELSSSLVNISELAIPNATLELPQIKRKDLQSLTRPDDVMRVRNGQFIDKKAARKRAERIAEAAAKKKGLSVEAAGADLPGRDEGATEYRIIINAPRNLWVRGADVNMELGLSEAFRIEYTEKLLVFGNVNIRRGTTSVIGRRFTIAKDSTVRFQGSASNPVVSLTAVYVNEREGITVFMGVRYDTHGLTLRPTSQPPLSETEIWTLLATGRRQLKRGSGSSMTGAEAATIVSSAVASELRKTLPSKVPLDVLSIEGGDEGFTGSKLEAGTYVTDKIYIGYTGRLGADPQKGENSNAVRFEYQFSPRWSFESSWGDANAGGADIVWTRDY